ncbi:hypothetical protein DFH08DRAFT_972988 [Mycena albidolilacea]|uniref:MYND-type domain-containing protein n=1 Tax=Mycena albidolilacea TaxID=1033008 RepID=A0AAD6Z9S4_9AGAR|nr:hypothetical protein DFH08DRAFT_972988 [Mycena albidolilacea]
MDVQIIGCALCGSIHFSSSQIISQQESMCGHITFEVVKIGWYEIYCDEEIDALYREFIASIGPELAHNSEAWACLGCGGRPAPQTGWVSLYTEKINKRCSIIIRPQCEECMPKLQDTTRRSLEVLEAKEGLTWNTIPMPDSMSNGLSGACLTCRKEHTAAPDFAMLRCAKCKLVRYCGAACQKEDWICGKITNVSRSVGPRKKASRLPKSPEANQTAQSED